MFLNIILIIALLGLAAYFIYYYYKLISKADNKELPENPYTLEYLVRTVTDIFAERQASNVRDMNLSRDELANKQRQQEELRKALHQSAFGDKESKDYIILSIRDMMRRSSSQGGVLNIDEETIERVIPFSVPNRLKAQDKFEIMMHLYKKQFDDQGLTQFLKDYEMLRPHIDKGTGDIHYEVNPQMIDEAYDDVMKDQELTYFDKLDILSHRIFSKYKGFGAADILFDFAIDEIDCGVSGIPKDAYKIKQVIDLAKNDNGKNKILQYTYRSVWVMVSGLKVHFSFMGFDSQQELVRVCQNIYKYDASEMLSMKKGYVIATMVNGSRIVVVRPPMASSWAFFARKFDSVKSVDPMSLLTNRKATIDENPIIPVIVLKWLMRGYQNSVISGGMGTGKTTLLKSIFRFLPADLATRVYEITAELNLEYTYLYRNILALEETEIIKMQEMLDLGMKLNSDITILGEMASQESVEWYVQSARKGSKLAIGTIHTKTVRALISYVRDSMHGYSNERAAEEAAIEAIKFDIHLEKEKDHRFLERITQIVPVDDRRYPSQMPEAENRSVDENHMLDEMEYQHRITDRQLFKERNIVEYRDGKYHFNCRPTEDIMLSIRSVLSNEEEKQMFADFKMLEELEKKSNDKTA